MTLYVFFSLALAGQVPEYLHKYYYYINKAELSIIDSNYKSAVKYYDTAFICHSVPFAKDLYNAGLCYEILGNYSKTYLFLKPVLQRGYDISMLDTQNIFKGFCKSKYWKKLRVEYNHSSFYTYNPYIRKTIDSLFYMDQFFRLMPERYSKYLDTICKIDTSNSQMLSSLINRYGYPDEIIYGLSKSITRQNHDLIIIHQSVGSRCKSFSFTDILYRAITEGKILNSKAAYLLMRDTGNDLFGYYLITLTKYVLDTSTVSRTNEYYNELDSKFQFGLVPVKKDVEERINKSRAGIGLESIADARKKVLFTLKDDRFVFLDTTKSVFRVSNYDDFQKFMENLVVVQ